METSTSPDVDTLTGWKEISAYLGRSVRSAQRWEAELGLPVTRTIAADGSQTVSASRAAIEAWRRQQASRGSRPTRSPSETLAAADDERSFDREDTLLAISSPAHDWPTNLTSSPSSPTSSGSAESKRFADVAVAPTRRLEARRFVWPAALVATLIAGIGGGLAIGMRPVAGVATRFEVEGHLIRALTDSERTVWTWPLAAEGRRPDMMAHSIPSLGDLDGDGSLEVAIAVTYAATERLSDASDAVMLFDARGDLRWTVQSRLRLGHGADATEGPWRLRDVAFGPTPSSRVWIAYSHDQPSRPSFVLEVTADGHQTLRYLHEGQITYLAHWRTTRGAFLVVGGSDGAVSRPSVTLVSLDGPPARWPIDATGPECSSCPTAAPSLVVLLPRTELGRIRSRAGTTVMRMMPIRERLRVETDDGIRPAVKAWLNADLRVDVLEPTPRYWALHHTYEEQGRVGHSVEQCPDRLDPAMVREWRPALGWRDYVVMPTDTTLRPLGTATLDATADNR